MTSAGILSGSVYGQVLTLTATVSSAYTAAGSPSGTVQFQIDGTDVGDPTTLVKGRASIVLPGLNAANYQLTATYSSNTLDFGGSTGSSALTVGPAPVRFMLQSNFDWLATGPEVTVAIASTTATSNGVPLIPDGTVTFCDSGSPMPNPQSLAVVDGQDQAVLDTTMLTPGMHSITVDYRSASGNFAMTPASPVLTEIVFPADANVLTVTNTSNDPSVENSLPWAVAQANASNVATVITFATQSGQAFATPQKITLETPLDVTDTNCVGIEGPSWGVTLVGDYSQSRFPILSVAQNAGVSIEGVNIGTQNPGANGDLQVAGVVDVIGTVANVGSALSVAGGGVVGLGGQTVTADTFTLTDGSLTDGTLSSGARTALSGMVSANLTGTGGLVKNGSGNVVLSGTNGFSGGIQVFGGGLVFTSAAALPEGSSLTVGAGAASLFGASQAATNLSAVGLAAPVHGNVAESENSRAIAAAGTVAKAPSSEATDPALWPFVKRQVENLSHRAAISAKISEMPAVASKATIDAVFASQRTVLDRTISSANNAQSAQLWSSLAAIESCWNPQDQNKTADLKVEALDKVLARFGV
jgi:autotransporter-associated beta strand protein